MSEIKVNTDDLRNNASTFNTEAQNLNNALSELLSVINSLDLGKYQSQLSDRVRLRVTPIQDDTLRYQGRLAELADQLKNKAQAFEQANAANAADTAQLSNQMYDFANSSAEMTASATLKKMDTKKANITWGFGGSFFGDLIKSITLFPALSLINRYLQNQTNSIVKDDTQKTTDNIQFFDNLEGACKRLDYKTSDNHQVYQDFPKYKDGTLHPGVDFGPLDDSLYQIFPIGPGIVYEVGTKNKYGHYVMIEHKVLNTETNEIKTIYSYYAHLAEEPDLKAFNSSIQINVTDPIGIMGNSGTDDIHLHLEVRSKANPVGHVTWVPPDSPHKIEKSMTNLEVLNRDFYDPKIFYEEGSKYIFLPVEEW